MKKMIVPALLLAAMSTSVYAKDSKKLQTTIATSVDEEKTKIDPASLPEAVKATLASDTYKDWKITNAWSVKADPAYYSVELKKDDKTNIVNLDKDGKVK